MYISPETRDRLAEARRGPRAPAPPFTRGNARMTDYKYCQVQDEGRLRIVTLTLLGAYVDPRILDSQAHRSGGIPFFVVGLVLLAPVLYALIRSEKKGLSTEYRGLSKKNITKDRGTRIEVKL